MSDSWEGRWIFQDPWNDYPRQSLYSYKVRKFSYYQVQIDLVTDSIMTQMTPDVRTAQTQKSNRFYTLSFLCFGLSPPISFSLVACNSDPLLFCCLLFGSCCVFSWPFVWARELIQRYGQFYNFQWVRDGGPVWYLIPSSPQLWKGFSWFHGWLYGLIG